MTDVETKLGNMRRDQPYLWQRPQNGVYYIIYYTDPPNVRKRMESLKTRDFATAQDRLELGELCLETSN